MDERASRILEATIREFIRTGEPVSSGELYEHYQFGIKPAMIRAELNDLTERGYLEQSHHSAGRVPSNKGYELFAARVFAKETNENNIDPVLHNMIMGRHWKTLIDFVSVELGALSVVGELSRDLFYKEGLDRLIRHVSWDSREEVMQVIEDCEGIEERMQHRVFPEEHNMLEVFIGRKSPWTRSNALAVLASDMRVHGKRMVFLAVGPKRMDYEKAARIFKGLKSLN